MTALIARIAALKTTPTPDLQAQWRELFETEPPRRNRGYLESRIAYRIQELEHGGLSPATVARLEALGDDPRRRRCRRSASAASTTGRSPAPASFVNTRAVEHCVTVLADGFEYQGRPYKSLSAVARAITGTRWNGPLFFGLRNSGGGR